MIVGCAACSPAPVGSLDGGGGAGGSGGGTAGGSGGGTAGIDGGSWIAIASLPGGVRQETGVAEVGGKIYVVGGFVMNGGIVPRVEAFDPDAGTWATVAPLPRAVHHANVAAVAGKLYVVGALEGLGFTALADVYEYTPSTNTWAARTPLPMAQRRGGSGVAVVGTKIYIAGGLRSGAVAEFSAYDTATDTHESLPALPTLRDHLVCAAFGTTIFAIGGRGGSITSIEGRVDAFDTIAKTWSPKTPMLTPRGGAAVGTFSDFFVVAGGEGNSSASSGVFAQVEAYYPASNAWRALSPMKTPRHGTGGAVVDGVFYVPGGATVQAFGATQVCEAWRP